MGHPEMSPSQPTIRPHVRVGVAHESPLVRMAIRLVLADVGNFQLAAEGNTAAEALALLRVPEVDVVVMDFVDPWHGDLDALTILQTCGRPAKAVIWSECNIADWGVVLMQAGVGAYLERDCGPGDLVRAVASAGSGRRFVTPELADLFAQHLDMRWTQPPTANMGDMSPRLRELFAPREDLVRQAVFRYPHETLTSTELETFTELALGATATRIASRRGVRRESVLAARRRILKKLGRDSDVDLTRYALSHQLIT